MIGRIGKKMRHMLVCVGAALLTGYQFFLLAEPPDDAIRHELKATAGEMRNLLVPEPSPPVLAAMRQDFAGREVSIAPILASSIVTVTLHGLDRNACVGALAKARRIDGPVVVQLQGNGTAADCGSRNEMTWWVMP
jgi:hypothetical protein